MNTLRPSFQTLTHRLLSAAFALVMTLGTLGGIDRLAHVEESAGQLAQTGTQRIGA
jgi:hypothetical protein